MSVCSCGCGCVSITAIPDTLCADCINGEHEQS